MKRRSLANSAEKTDNSFNLALFEQALKDPNSKNLILNLLASHSQKKNVFELFNDKPNSDSAKSPLKKFKKKNVCESPTALLRRRELEKMNRPESAQSNDSESTQSSSSDIPFESILKNVTAYVEVNSNGNDRSGGVKALLRSMGAVVKDNFTRDVTHVIFKDGSYHTYQKAKLSKVHFVSVLWLETTRRNGSRAPEKNYPALGTKNYDLNISLICSQMQKDYEEVVRDEIRRTLESGTPLPSLKSSSENRRRTIASTSKSFNTSFNSRNIITSIREDNNLSETPKKSLELSSTSVDEELSRISQNVQNHLENDNLDSFSYQSFGKEGEKNSCLLTSDSEPRDSEILTSDSECGMVDGVFTGSNFLEDSFEEVGQFKSTNSNMDLTCGDGGSDDSNSRSLIFDRRSVRRKSRNLTKISENSMDLTNVDDNNDETQNDDREKSKKKFDSTSKTNKKRINTDETSDEEIYRMKTPVLPKRKTLHPIFLLSDENSKNKGANDSTMSSLRISNNSSKDNNKTAGSTDMSSLRVSSNKENVSDNNNKSSSVMSSLRISTNSKENVSANDKSSSVMSSLRGSANSKENTSANDKSSSAMSSLRISSEKPTNGPENLNENNMITLPKDLNNETSKDQENVENSTPFVTERKKRRYSKNVAKKSSEENIGKRLEKEEEEKESCTSKNDSNLEEESAKSTTPFVTLRKKRRLTEMPGTEETLKENSNQGLDVLQYNPTTDVSTPRKEILAVRREIKNFEDNAKKRKSFHDKSKEVEINSNKNNPGGEENRQHAAASSPFVTTRSRRKSVMLGRIEEKEEEENRLNIDSINEQLLDEVIQVGGGDNSETKDEPIPKTRIRRSNRISTNKNNSRKVNESDSSLLERDNSSIEEKSNTTREPIILLENILISPQKNYSNDKNSLQSKKKKENNSNDEEKEEEEEKSVRTRRKRRTDVATPTNDKRKQEDVIRRSTRIRRLYDPDEVEQEFRVDDNEERDKIRTEKKTNNDVSLPKGIVSRNNLLLTQKALEYLERNRNNREGIRTLFKSPEAVLESLGIEKKKKSEMESNNNKRGGSVMNRSADEQTKLAEEFVYKKSRAMTQPTPASRKTPKTKRPVPRAALTQQALPTARKNETSTRRSTLEFEPRRSRSVKTVKSRTQFDYVKPTIVCTKMHKPEVELFQQIVKKLGVFEVVDEVDARTTHLVAGELKRTINMLRALARGCWILKKEWLLSSLEHRKWLPEEKYEAVEFSPAVQKCRLERTAFGPTYKMNIFINCGKIYVARSTNPRCSDLRELISTCHGKAARSPEGAAIAVGAFFDGVTCVNEQWVLDSISGGKLKSVKKYKIEREIASWVTKSPFV